MFDDPKRDLKRLEQELLAGEEEWMDEELSDIRQLLEEEDAEEVPVRNYANGYGVENTDRVDVDLDAYSDALLTEQPVKEKGIRGLLVLISLELLGIAAIAVYWLVQLS